MKKWMGLAVILVAATLVPRNAEAACPPGTTLDWACYSWQNDCEPTWIKTCWCCVNVS